MRSSCQPTLINGYKEYIVILVDVKSGCIQCFMKKDTVITIRVTPEIKSIVQRLADEDDRTLAWMARKLITEALESRGILKPEKKHK